MTTAYLQLRNGWLRIPTILLIQRLRDTSTFKTGIGIVVSAQNVKGDTTGIVETKYR